MPAAWIAFALPACDSPVSGGGERPNVVIVSLDTVRWDHTSLAGYGRDTTPELARLAAMPGSTTFERAYTTSSWSLPSYASLFTGLDGLDHGLGFTRSALQETTPTLAGLLSTYGYQTAAFGSGPHLDPATGLSNGFDAYLHLTSQSSLVAQTDVALQWLDERDEGAPFFLFMQGYDAHLPYVAPSILSEMYNEGDSTVHGDNGRRCHARPALDDCVQLVPLDTVRNQPPNPTSPEAVEHTIGHYDAAIRAADYQLGRILWQLSLRGLLDESIVVVMADHGESLGEEQGAFDHGFAISEAVIHVPLVVHLPESAPPARSDALVTLSSVLPTLLAALDIPVPAGMGSPDLLAVARGEEAPVDAVVSASMCCYSVRTRDWQLRTWHSNKVVVRTPAGPRQPAVGIELASLPEQPAWSLLADGLGPDVAAEHPALVAELAAHGQAWPSDVPLANEGHGAAADTPQLREALRERGYWSSEPGDLEGGSPEGGSPEAGEPEVAP